MNLNEFNSKSTNFKKLQSDLMREINKSKNVEIDLYNTNFDDTRGRKITMNSDRKNISFEYDARSTSETREFSSKLKDLKLSILTKGMNINSEDLNMNPSYTFKYESKIHKTDIGDRLKNKIVDFFKITNGGKRKSSRTNGCLKNEAVNNYFSENPILKKKSENAKKDILNMLANDRNHTSNLRWKIIDDDMKDMPKQNVLMNCDMYPNEIVTKMKKKFPELIRKTSSDCFNKTNQSNKLNRMKNTINKLFDAKK